MDTAKFVRERLAQLMNPDTFIGQQKEIRQLEQEIRLLIAEARLLRAHLKSIYACRTLTGREAVQTLIDAGLLKVEDVT